MSYRGDGGSGGSGSGITLGPKQNEFGTTSTASLAAAVTLRNTYATANAAWLAQYNANRSFYIRLRWTNNAQVYQRRNAAGTAWEDVTNLAPGVPGRQGPPGPLPTESQVKTLYESNPDTNVFDDAAQSKLAGIEDNATGDQSAIEIKTEYESNPNTNTFTDDDKNKLAGIEPNAKGDLTAAEISNLLDNRLGIDWRTAGLTLSQILSAIIAGNGIDIDRDSANKIIISVAGSTSGGSHGGGPVVATRHIRAGWSPDTSISDAELSAMSLSNEITLPDATGLNYLALWRADSDGGDPSEVHLSGGGNSRNLFGAAVARSYNGLAGQLIVSVFQQNADLLSGEKARLV